MENQVRTEIMEIDADDAARFLEKNKEYEPGTKGTNRKTYQPDLQKWANDMVRGRWRLTHQGVAFDNEGFLVDGQNRLKALIMADRQKRGVTIKMMVTYGLDAEVFRVIDTGRRRKLSDVLSFDGYPNVTALSSAAKLHYCYHKVPYKLISSWSGTIPEWNGIIIGEWVAANPTLVSGVELVCDRGSTFRSIGNSSALSAGYALATQIRPDVDWDEFMRQLAEGLGSTKMDPAWQLREKLRKRMAALRSIGRSGHSTERIEQLALFIKAANAFAKGEEPKALHWTSGGEKSFPLLEALVKGA